MKAKLAAAGLFALVSGQLAATELPPVDEALLGKLRAGGYVIYLRHASTDARGPGDQELVDFGNCATQRNLSAAGRDESARIGKAVRSLRIPVGAVLASPYCRARDTAQLAFGRHKIRGELHYAIDVSDDERQRLAAALRAMLGTPPARGSNSVIVSHSANLREAAGIWPKPEGAAYVFQPLPEGGFKAVARMLPQDWPALGVR